MASNAHVADGGRNPARQTLLGTLGSLPGVCAVMTAIAALYSALVAVGNITDFGTNLVFVRGVLSMETTNFGAPPGTDLDPDIMWRAIANPQLQVAAYVVIIVWESLTAIVLIAATARWIEALRSRSFTGARQLATVGFLMLVILFMGGFIAIGGEWFQMWRSTAWNGVQPAFQNAVLALFGIVLIQLPSPHWTPERLPEVAAAK